MVDEIDVMSGDYNQSDVTSDGGYKSAAIKWFKYWLIQFLVEKPEKQLHLRNNDCPTLTSRT